MDNKKIAKFILELRKEKNLTQEELANMIPIGRGAISKWERGITIPDSTVLLKLSEIFDISINEILIGKRKSKNQNDNKEIEKVTIDLYDSSKKNKRNIKIMCFITIVILFLFFLYYFLNNYNSVKIYTINGESESFSIENGLFIQTNKKMYFNIGKINYNNEISINNMKLYYKVDNNENIIYEENDDNFLILDTNGYNEYFNKKNLNSILNNLYLQINYNDNNIVDLKLNFTKDYTNNELFLKSEKNIKDNNKNVLTEEKITNDTLIDFIEKNFEYNDLFCTYNEQNNEFIYNPMSGELMLSLFDNEKLIKQWVYLIKFDQLNVTAYENRKIIYEFTNENKNNVCKIGNCENDSEDIDYFWNLLNKI